MPLSKERFGEIALMGLKAMKCDQGITLKPKETRRDTHNMAKQLDITVPEAAEFIRTLLREIYNEVDQELENLTKGK